MGRVMEVLQDTPNRTRACYCWPDPFYPDSADCALGRTIQKYSPGAFEHLKKLAGCCATRKSCDKVSGEVGEAFQDSLCTSEDPVFR